MTDRVKILIIDDEEIVLKSCLKILSDERFEIDTASSAEEGLDKIKVKHYHLVITDIKMSGMTGLELLKKIKQEHPEIIVIIFTGFATVETTREALKNGAFDYIPKPFTPEEFLDVVNNSVKIVVDKTDAKMLDLMAVVSHELKSPIAVVHTGAQTLHKGYLGDLDPKQQKTIEAILRNCQYLEDIIRNYLDMSKIEMEDFGSYKENKNLVEEIIMQVTEIPEHKNNLRNMPIVCDFRVRPIIYVDAYLIQIVVTNFINNAIKYGKEGTEINVSLYDNGTDYVFSVMNYGVGMSQEEIDTKLFKKYSRLKQKGTEGIKGTGLGLYMCKTIIEKHLGRVWAESKQGEWVKLCFSLPKT